MSDNVERRSRAGPSGLALLMESDVELSAVIRAGLLLDGHRVESMANCAEVLAWRARGGPAPGAFLLALGAGEADPDWDALHAALDEDATLAKIAVIVLLTIRNGLTFPARARILQKPFAMEKLLALVAKGMTAGSRLPV
jgi:hypothetical protein